VLKKPRNSRMYFWKLYKSLAIEKMSTATHDVLLRVEIARKFDRRGRLNN